MKNFFKIFILILKKDILVETREKLNLVYLLILSPTLSLIAFVFIGSDNPTALFFFTSLIVALLANQRVSRQEVSLGGDLILISAPCDLSIVCFSKILFFILINIFINLIVFITLSLISEDIFLNSINFLTLCFLFSVGISSILSTFSLMLERIKGEGHFMFILIYPLILPFLLLSYNSILLIDLYGGESFFSSFSLQALVAFDILLLTICPILFSYSIRR